MFKFECKDLGMECDFIVTAASQEEVMELSKAHAVEIHAKVFQELTSEQIEEMNAKLESLIQTEETGEILSEELTGDDEIEGDEEEDEEDFIVEAEEDEEATEIA